MDEQRQSGLFVVTNGPPPVFESNPHNQPVSQTPKTPEETQQRMVQMGLKMAGAHEDVAARAEREKEQTDVFLEVFKQIQKQLPENATKEQVAEALINADMQINGTSREEAEAKLKRLQEQFAKDQSNVEPLKQRIIKEGLDLAFNHNDLNAFLDNLFARPHEGRDWQSILESGSSGEKIGREYFEALIKVPHEFAKTMDWALKEALQRMGWKIDLDNIDKLKNQQEPKARERMIKLIGEIYHELFKLGEDNKKWNEFAHVFAQAMYPNKKDVVLDERVRQLIRDVVENNKFDELFGKQSQPAVQAGPGQPVVGGASSQQRAA